jgi:uncharacterized membrane protein HdeD (DUF308 family)
MNIGAKQTGRSSKDWGLVGGGIVVFLFGIVCFIWPGLPMLTIVMVAGAALIVAGVFDIFSWIHAKKIGGASGWALANGICNIVLGFLFLVHPIIASDVIIVLVGWLMIAYGVFALVSAMGLRGTGGLWWMMCAMGVVSLVCGLMFLIAPALFMYFLGALLLMRGITMASFGLTSPQDLRF